MINPKRPIKNSKGSSASRLSFSQSGQAAVEYILLLTVVAMIALAVKNTLFGGKGGLNDFIGDAMGTYVSCLLETGELPLLGATDDDDTGKSTCSIKPLNANGSDSADATSAGSTAAGSGKTSSSSSSSSADDDKAPGSSGGSGGDDGGGGRGGGSRSRGRSGYAGRGANGGQFGMGQASQNRASAGSDGEGGEGANKRFGGGDSGGGSANGFFGPNSRQSGPKPKFLTGSLATDEVVARAKKAQQRGENKVNLPPLEGGSNGATKERVGLAAPEKKTRTVAEVDIGSFDLGQLIKIFLVAGIIIIFLVLIGGQALSLSKSWEKGE